MNITQRDFGSGQGRCDVWFVTGGTRRLQPKLTVTAPAAIALTSMKSRRFTARPYRSRYEPTLRCAMNLHSPRA
jgi:hypothetical protein